MNYKHIETKNLIEDIEENIRINQSNVSDMINKSTNFIQEDLKERIKEFLQAKTISPDEVKNLIANKADKCEIIDLDQIKANRTEITDGDEKHTLAKNQLQHLSVLIMEIIQLHNSDLEAESPLLPNSKYLLKQSLKIYDWIKGKEQGNDSEFMFSPKFNEKLMETDDSSLLKVRPITTKRKSYNNSDTEEEIFKTYRSTSNRRPKMNNKLIESLRGNHEHPMIRAKAHMVYKSKPKISENLLNKNKIHINMSTSTYGERSFNDVRKVDALRSESV